MYSVSGSIKVLSFKGRMEPNKVSFGLFQYIFPLQYFHTKIMNGDMYTIIRGRDEMLSRRKLHFISENYVKITVRVSVGI
jgi:hypothetical protein